MVTQNNASNAEELASTAVEAAEQVQIVRDLVLQHRLASTSGQTGTKSTAGRIRSASPSVKAPLPAPKKSQATKFSAPDEEFEDTDFPMEAF